MEMAPIGVIMALFVLMPAGQCMAASSATNNNGLSSNGKHLTILLLTLFPFAQTIPNTI